MTCNEVSLVDVVRALDRVVTKTQVGNCDTACLLGVILEVSLDVFVGVVTDDLGGVLVGTNGTVSAQTPELTFYCTRSRCDRSRFNFRQGQVGNVVHDTDGETRLRIVFLKLCVYSKYG